MRTPHTSFKQGTKIRIILRDGKMIVTKFLDKKSGKMITTDGEINIADIRSCSFYKPHPHEMK